MKKIITLTLFIISAANLVIAQNATIAKLKYEEAEEAYAANDYSLALNKLNEVEAMLKSTNPKIMYLKICSLSKMIEANPFKDFTLIESARTLSAKYLNDYETLPDNEEKYRTVYKISESLKKFPTSQQEFDKQIKQIKNDAEAKKNEELDRIKKAEEYFMNFVYFKDFQIGLSVDETTKKYPAFKKHYTWKENDGTYDYFIAPKGNTPTNGPSHLYIRNYKVIGYFATATMGPAYKTQLDIINELNEAFNFKSIESTTSGRSYTWKKNSKTITISLIGNDQLYIYSIDQNLAK